MNNCIAVVSDLIFATRITGTAEKLGSRCTVVRNLPSLQKVIEVNAPRTVLVDMHVDGVAPDEAIRIVKSACPDARVVAFFSHVQTELMVQAKEAGADDVWPRSAFVQKLPDLLAQSNVTENS